MPKARYSRKSPNSVLDPITGVKVRQNQIYENAFDVIGNRNYFGVGESILDAPQNGTSYAAEWEFGQDAIVATFVNHKYDPSAYPEGRSEYVVYRSVLLGSFTYSKKGEIRGTLDRVFDGSSSSDSEFNAGGDPDLFPPLLLDNIWDWTSPRIFPLRFNSVSNLRAQIQENVEKLDSAQIWSQGEDRSVISPEVSKYFGIEFWQDPFTSSLA